jgi:hypothetical protein
MRRPGFDAERVDVRLVVNKLVLDCFFPSNISFFFFLVIIIPNGRPGWRIGIATRCGPDGPEFEPQCGRDFPDPFRLTLNTTGPHVQLVPGLFPGGKAAGA